VVDHIVEHLARIDIDYIFGVDGANIEDLYDAAHFHSDITAVLAKHEFFRRHDGRRVQSQRPWFGCGGGRPLAAAALNLVPGLGEIISQPGAGVWPLVGQPANHDGWSGQLSRHQWSQRFAECRGVVFPRYRFFCPAGC